MDRMFGDMWRVASRSTTKGFLRGFAAGIVAPVCALVGTELLVTPPGNSSWIDPFTYAILLVISVYLVFGLVAWRRWGAYAWGSAIVIVIGVNTVELSGPTGINASRLYDSQTVDILFVCLVSMLTVRQLRQRHRLETCRHGNASACPSVIAATLVAARVLLKFASAPVRARRCNWALNICYLSLVGHAVWPAVAWLRESGPSENSRLLVLTIVATLGPHHITIATVLALRPAPRPRQLGHHRRTHPPLPSHHFRAHYPATPFSLNTSQTRSGRIGISMCVTPRCANASTTAFAMVGGAPTVADSPTPFAPSG